MASVEKRVVVITGGSRGLGLEFIRQLSQSPDILIITVVRNPNKSDGLKQYLGDKVVAIQGDMAEVDSFPSIAEKISLLGGGKVDVLINNAGIMIGEGASPSEGISKSTVGEWEQQFKVNVIGPVFFTNAIIPLLEKGQEKKVVNIASMLGDLQYTEKNPNLHFASYSATKAAVTMVNAKFDIEFKEKGFIFLALNPGWVKTDLAGAHMAAYAPLESEESISQCLRFINRSTVEHSGKFWSLDGNPEAVVM
ncbi:hypothetical protein BGW36DRAFT_410970 [Talaromyces proteolyticus]|uniref:NAD(P)-binding protein n=1 Tax=Talaromyces proteolyticus TaxID=1131652 RepID=A0AAD4PW80_9EURO|nr:uncharacterized protein BGW36DRAFT_410970 [Talaromyces proteolyticus]KAH8691239.1 hypothetical protein BGW36DRAFT_410970 [Talaromyces proteolyticus]